MIKRPPRDKGYGRTCTAGPRCKAEAPDAYVVDGPMDSYEDPDEIGAAFDTNGYGASCGGVRRLGAPARDRRDGCKTAPLGTFPCSCRGLPAVPGGHGAVQKKSAWERPVRTAYMECRQSRRVGDQRGAPAGTPADGGAPWSGGGAAPGALDPAGLDAGIPGSAQNAIGGQSQSLASAAALRRAATSVAASAPLALCARPELDSDRIGAYMRDAIARGGYRAALEYYGSDEAKDSYTERRRLRAKGWLLGRLGLYDRVGGWLDEVASLPSFGHLSGAAAAVQRADYRAPALWLEAPRPPKRSSDRILAVEPAAAPCPDNGAVPDYIWTTMLILDAVGPICSHAGLGAAAFLAGAGAGRHPPDSARGDRRYDLLRGARLHGAPEGCHRWIIADIDFDPWPVNRPHYYYDLTDEGHGAMGAARAAGAPWPEAAEAAASELDGMSLSDLLEGACGFAGPARDLGKMGDDLARLFSAWSDQERGAYSATAAAEDRALVDLGAAVMGPGAGGGGGDAALDRLLYIMTVVRATCAVAREAEPTSCAERAVLEALVGKIQDQCRSLGRAAAAAAPSSPTTPPPSVTSNPSAEVENAPQPPLYADAAPVLITDMYYCLSEYCRSRSLAVDPLSLPPKKQMTEDERAAVSEAIAKHTAQHGDAD